MRDKELRLALVCYGGISLAVYMHGITGEIWRLARASRAFHESDPSTGGTEAVYELLLGEIAEASNTRVRVLVDIIAGASAGGINGIFLAQAIASGQSLEPLTRLWLDYADIEALLSPDAAPDRFSKLWATPLAWLLADRGNTDPSVDADTREEVGRKLRRFVRSRWFEPPFGGKRLTHMVLDAIDAMAREPSGERLLPPGQPLDLFVTVTDFRGHPERLRLHSPDEVVETEHRLIFPFRDAGGGPANIGEPVELALAARATSSFPGAFPPVTLGEIDEVVAERGTTWPTRDPFLARVLPRHAAINGAQDAVLIDGSVLANAPFRPALDALRDRPAKRQIDRRFVYIDPVPGYHFNLGVAKAEAPGFLQTIIGAVSELPRAQPIRDNLEAIEARTERIERLRAMLAGLRDEVEEHVVRQFGYTLFLDYPTPARLSAWRRRAQIAAARDAGFAYSAYARLKLVDVVSEIVRLLQHAVGESNAEHRRRLNRCITDTLARQGITAEAAAEKSPKSDMIAFLRDHDLPFRIRRLRLLARRLSEMDEGVNEAALAPAREAIYASLADYLELQRPDRLHDLRPAIREFGNDAAPLLARLATATDLPAIDTQVDARLSAALSQLPRELRRPLLLAYLGFPYFDIATLPVLQGEGLDEFDPVKVDRISPDDATAIRAGGAAATLKGTKFHNFGAFFSRAYRENDYLWGRLHGADRLIDVVVSTMPSGSRLKPGRVAAIKRLAFLAILDAEEERLTAVSGLFDQLRAELG
ncbi:patatin-related protein [Sphingomonas guangdongensis]|uniref:Patatin-related protein n=1 Tax=Sphingomonas guangdongensis TaxID=1141890 RepID=A0A285R5X2_9SPHN|nr:patatin-like protein [Sphingomonas guangdongensis]SOB87752.1 patatin-related protein [Sphingomonas guangdongensis]